MWIALGINKEFGKKIKDKTKKFLKDKNLVKKIESIYGEMIIFYKNTYKI